MHQSHGHRGPSKKCSAPRIYAVKRKTYRLVDLLYPFEISPNSHCGRKSLEDSLGGELDVFITGVDVDAAGFS